MILCEMRFNPNMARLHTEKTCKRDLTDTRLVCMKCKMENLILRDKPAMQMPVFLHIIIINCSLKKLLADTCPFMEPLMGPCFRLLVMSPIGFKTRVDSVICTWWRHT